ncbi:MAG TPA: DUF420 domain-containing protein [Microscillaceae bacterium]|jgi:putative membrane protein|nr:DUF420 domain-containing protein [Microscillaceae bacterium]
MENIAIDKQNKLAINLIVGVSIVIVAVVAFLFYGPKITRIEGLNVSILPHINAVLNSATFCCLLLGYWQIKQKNIRVHRMLMMTAFVLSSIFLVSYVVYHNNAEHTSFGGVGVLRYAYFFILITHILLAIVVVPFVLLALFFALTNQIERHKRIVKWAYPIWAYVASSGVVVYWMISPYYQP